MKSIVTFLGIGLVAGLCGTGCQQGAIEAQQSAETGTIALPLKTNGPSGTEYRLRDATFQIWGYNEYGYTDELLSSETDPTAPSISVSLERGYYDIYLNPGWRMEKVTNGAAEAVEALLLSSTYQSVQVFPHSTSWVSYQFGIGDRKIWLNGNLNIEMQVYEDPDQYYGGGSGVVGEELITSEVKETGWISKSDTTAGIQGAVYTFGDFVTCSPPVEFNPCTAEGCCLDYTTILDATYASWGCGLGLELNSTGESEPWAGDSIKQAYAGNARGLAVTYTQSGTGTVRLSYTQKADTMGFISPFTSVKEGTNYVEFTSVACPSWDAEGRCTTPSMNPLDLQLQVVGGDGPTAGRICITSIKPIY